MKTRFFFFAALAAAAFLNPWNPRLSPHPGKA